MSPSAQALQFLINALSLGSLYALMALGLVIVYGILRLVNFAYGELIMVAGYALYLLGGGPLPWLVMALLAIVAAMATSVGTELVAFRPIRAKSLTAMLITSFALSTLLQNAALLLISPRPRVVPLPELFQRSVTIAGVQTPLRNLLAIGVSLAVLAGFGLLLRHSVLGIALRAAADKFTMTRLLGVPANLIIGVAFAISGLLAGVVALFWLGRTASVTPTIGLEPLLIAFIATVIGGMRSLAGAVLGGYVLGFITMAFNVLLPQELLDFRETFTFTLIIAILLFRPEGLVRAR